jgi:hypothetical protein
MTRRRSLHGFLWAMAAIVALAANAQQREITEAGIKAAFLYKFANYVEWPATAWSSPSAPLVIGVMGSEQIAAELERIVPGRSVNGHPVAVKRVRDAEGLQGLHMLFVGHDHGAQAAALKAARDQSVIAVTESERGLDLGSAINFVTAGDRVSFEVSLEAVERTGCRISARMLAVARKVVPKS